MGVQSGFAVGGCYDYPSVSFTDSSPDKGSLGAGRICRGVVRVRKIVLRNPSVSLFG